MRRAVLIFILLLLLFPVSQQITMRPRATSTEVSLGFKTSQATCSGVEESEYGGDELNVFASVASNGVDNDGDGYNSTVDCNDYNPLVHPGHAELCDRKDNDCDDHVDEPDVCLPGDADHRIEDNYYRVELADLALIGSGYGSVNGTERYEKCTNITEGFYCDLNDDGKVDVFDLAKVGKNFGKECLACVQVTIHVYDDFGPIFNTYVELWCDPQNKCDSGLTDIDGNWERCLEEQELEYYTRGWSRDGQRYGDKFFTVPEDTYILIYAP